MCVLTGTERRRDNTSQHRDLYVSEWEDVDEVRQPQELFRTYAYPAPYPEGTRSTRIR